MVNYEKTSKVRKFIGDLTIPVGLANYGSIGRRFKRKMKACRKAKKAMRKDIVSIIENLQPLLKDTLKARDMPSILQHRTNPLDIRIQPEMFETAELTGDTLMRCFFATVYTAMYGYEMEALRSGNDADYTLAYLTRLLMDIMQPKLRQFCVSEAPLAKRQFQNMINNTKTLGTVAEYIEDQEAEWGSDLFMSLLEREGEKKTSDDDNEPDEEVESVISTITPNDQKGQSEAEDSDDEAGDECGLSDMHLEIAELSAEAESVQKVLDPQSKASISLKFTPLHNDDEHFSDSNAMVPVFEYYRAYTNSEHWSEPLLNPVAFEDFVSIAENLNYEIARVAGTPMFIGPMSGSGRTRHERVKFWSNLAGDIFPDVGPDAVVAVLKALALSKRSGGYTNVDDLMKILVSQEDIKLCNGEKVNWASLIERMRNLGLIETSWDENVLEYRIPEPTVMKFEEDVDTAVHNIAVELHKSGPITISALAKKVHIGVPRLRILLDCGVYMGRIHVLGTLDKTRKYDVTINYAMLMGVSKPLPEPTEI